MKSSAVRAQGGRAANYVRRGVYLHYLPPTLLQLCTALRSVDNTLIVYHFISELCVTFAQEVACGFVIYLLTSPTGCKWPTPMRVAVAAQLRRGYILLLTMSFRHSFQLEGSIS